MLFAGVTTILQRQLVQAMDRLGDKIQASEPAAIQNFRRVHSAALLSNLLPLSIVAWGILRLSQELTPR